MSDQEARDMIVSAFIPSLATALAAARLAGKLAGLREADGITLLQARRYAGDDAMTRGINAGCSLQVGEIRNALAARIAEIEKGARDE